MTTTPQTIIHGEALRHRIELDATFVATARHRLTETHARMAGTLPGI